MYNLTVEGEHEYYAQGVLVSNCDAFRYALQEIVNRSYVRQDTTPPPSAADGVRAARRAAQDVDLSHVQF